MKFSCGKTLCKILIHNVLSAFVDNFFADLRYKINTNGELIEKYDLKKMFGDKFFFSSSSRFFMMSDYNTLIFEAEIDAFMDGLKGPLSAVFTYNLRTKETQRITKKGFCSSGLWIDA